MFRVERSLSSAYAKLRTQFQKLAWEGQPAERAGPVCYTVRSPRDVVQIHGLPRCFPHALLAEPKPQQTGTGLLIRLGEVATTSESTNVIQRADVRMLQLGNRLGLTLEPLAQLGIERQMLRQHLDRDLAVERRIDGLPNLAHATLADLVDEREVQERLSPGKVHGGGV